MLLKRTVNICRHEPYCTCRSVREKCILLRAQTHTTNRRTCEHSGTCPFGHRAVQIHHVGLPSCGPAPCASSKRMDA